MLTEPTTTLQESMDKTRRYTLSRKHDKPVEQRLLLTIDIIEQCLTRQKSATEAARALSEIYDPRVNKIICSLSSWVYTQYVPGPNSLQTVDIDDLWSLLCSCGGDGHEPERLADLVIALHELPEVAQLFRTTEGKWVVLWRDMPDFGFHMREYYMWTDGLPKAEDKEQMHKLQCSTAFAATVIARLPPGKYKEITGSPFFASQAIEEGLEQPSNLPVGRDEAVWFKPAAIWLIVAGKKLYELSFGDMKEAYNVAATQKDWGTKTFSKDRWLFWRQRCYEISKDEEAEQEKRDLAARALESMLAAERENGL